MNIVAIYPGRFQPFGPHHKRAFDWLCSKFGADNCWISTSDNRDIRSPLSFDEKVSIIKKYGIENVLKSSSPYRLTDPRFDPKTTILFVMLGEKDEARIQYFKQDGTPGYYQEYFGQRDLESMDKCGYVVIMPHISMKIDDIEISGSQLRKLLPSMSPIHFESVMGWYDESLHNLFKCRFHEEVSELMRVEFMDESVDAVIRDTVPISRHIHHLYEDEQLSRDEIISILSGITSGTIPVFEKFDGVNLKVSIKNKQIVAARNRHDMSYPLTLYQLKDRYAGKYNLQLAFSNAFLDCVAFVKSLPVQLQDHIESNDYWINLEIVNPILDSGYRYGMEPLLVIHGMVDFNWEIVDGFDLTQFLPAKMDHYTIIGPNKLKIPNMPIYISQVAGQIRNTKNLEQIINDVSWNLLSNTSGYLAQPSDIRMRIGHVGNMVARTLDSTARQKYFTNLEKLNFGKILPFEGIVFNWQGKMYKLTGYFKYQNQILHLFRK